MRLSFWLIPVLIFILSCNDAVQNEKTIRNIPVKDGWIRYSSENYTIDAPADWEYDTSNTMGTAFVLFAPWDTMNTMFRENVNAMMEELDRGMFTPKAYAERAVQLLGEYMTDMRDVKLTADGDRYWLKFNAQQGTLRLHFTQMFDMKDDIVYILTFTSNRPGITPTSRVAEEIIASFVRM